MRRGLSYPSLLIQAVDHGVADASRRRRPQPAESEAGEREKILELVRGIYKNIQCYV